ncbi:hypothetical protein HJFPF1_11211 [Paramyrothecium foliicola]|nr:hypothetical protein HJFPF1_11211 [Paramyrothecium foliicola]
MLSHLRFHRRGHSNPSSPYPDQPPSPSFSGGQLSPYVNDNLSPHDGRPPSPGSSSTMPPSLPPIARVTSADPDLSSSRQNDFNTTPHLEARSPQPLRSPYNNESGFIGGVALRNYRRDLEAQAAGRYQSIDSVSGVPNDGKQPHHQPRPVLSPIDTATSPAGHYVKPASFSTSTKVQGPGAPAIGRRPVGTRLTTEPASLSVHPSTSEPPKGKKSLPFLKNPMSGLLMRRKNNQNVPDLLPLPLRTGGEEPTYDPRIRGTRVHDFSAPRRKNIPQSESSLSILSAKSDQPSAKDSHFSPLSDGREGAPPADSPRLTSSISDPNRGGATIKSPSPISQSTSMPLQQADTLGTESSSEDAPPVPPKDDTPSSSMNSSRRSQAYSRDFSAIPRTNASVRTTLSKKISLSEASNRDTISSLPRHMKSTSSRFSFDMIGAAKAEKLLEERHRQRYVEKNMEEENNGPRDSRFDDFDEDAFDYDAMMDDDGFEERIPGVNADYDDDAGFEEEIPMVNTDYDEDDYLVDEDDPNNDQENFAGFVFSRSNPSSSLASPQSAGMMITPRDAEGRVIGFAVTQHSPHNATLPISPHQPSPLFQASNAESSGLGIQGMDFPATSVAEVVAPGLVADLPPGASQGHPGDDLYFDNGMVGFEDEFAEDLAASPEWDTAPFDESIFDNIDTDKYGRPIPGAFAQAQSLRQAALQTDVKRESDIASQLSAHSAAHSTAHTSLSADFQKSREDGRGSVGSVSSAAEVVPPDVTGTQNHSVAVYQAALAAAAYEAAASGKFQRQASPPRDDSITLSDQMSNRSPVQEDDFVVESVEENYLDTHSYEALDDYELDDDAIIAEANASALANDSDGWYGQEFGFYAKPTNQQHGSHNGSSSTAYEYSNGGFFGPKGLPNLARTMSGRLVSREPNLTPITERSEYSNRNSIMSSLGMPGFGPGTPIQSPGLAQLAMMAERGDDQMSLSALMRLRSKAWGGSQASLSSSREGSPRSEYSPWGANGAPNVAPVGGHARKNSVFSTMSRDSEAGSISGSPTLTMGMSYLASPPPPLPSQSEFMMNSRGSHRNSLRSEASYPPVLEVEIPSHTDVHDGPLSAVSEVSSSECTSASAATRRPGMGHRHKGSADSISYMKEEDCGETRWVMERRRTAETGEVEILEREVVEGGRI